MDINWLCVCACVRACVHACARARVCVSICVCTLLTLRCCNFGLVGVEVYGTWFLFESPPHRKSKFAYLLHGQIVCSDCREHTWNKTLIDWLIPRTEVVLATCRSQQSVCPVCLTDSMDRSCFGHQQVSAVRVSSMHQTDVYNKCIKKMDTTV